jgi:hypothetical protein
MNIHLHLHERAYHRGLHGADMINRQRQRALRLAVFSFVRMSAWLLLMVAYALHTVLPQEFHWTVALFTSVSFVALISLYANAATDYGAGSANLAELTAGDAHKDTEHVRRAVDVDYEQVESDIAELAGLQPGPDAQALAEKIRTRLREGR